MVYSNACYAPGAGETEETTPSSEEPARTRVKYYSRPIPRPGGTYFASDLGSQSVVNAILDNPDEPFGDIFAMASGYSRRPCAGFPIRWSVAPKLDPEDTGPRRPVELLVRLRRQTLPGGRNRRRRPPTSPRRHRRASSSSVSFFNEQGRRTVRRPGVGLRHQRHGRFQPTEPGLYVPTPGTYSVTLTATNSLGHEHDDSDELHHGGRPAARAPSSPSRPPACSTPGWATV